jgi:hypothetical protein
MSVCVEISYGELIDKITILEIRERHAADPLRRRNVMQELTLLKERRRTSLPEDPRLDELQARLRDVNARLWDIEDRLREKERDQAFDPEFIELARSVYRTNDLRSKIKRDVNELFESRLIEEKLYQEY